MPVSSAAKLASHLWRGAAQTAASAAHNSANTFRGAFHGASNGSSSSTPSASGWTSGLSGGGGSAGTGAGGAKYHAGRGTHSTYQQSNRALSQASATSSNDADGKTNDDDEEARLQQLLAPRVTSPERNIFLRAGNLSRTHMQVRFTQSFAPYSTPYLLEPTDATSSRDSAFESKQTSAPSSIDKGTELDDAGQSDSAPLVVEDKRSLKVSTHSVSILRGLNHGVQRRDAQKVRECIEALNRLPKRRQTTELFNAVIEALLAIREQGQPISEIVEVYTRMIKEGRSPDSHTFGLLVRALCIRDVEIYSSAENATESEDNFGKAVELTDVAHNIGANFNDEQAYNAMLQSCAARGDLDRALSILSLSEKSGFTTIKTNAHTFKYLLQTCVQDRRISNGESSEAQAARKLKVCQNVFEEFLAASKSPQQEALGHLVWAELMEAHFALNDSAGAVKLLERVLEGGPGVPPLQPTIISAMIKGFIVQADTATALQWFQKLTPDSLQGSLPSPDVSTIEQLICAVAKSDQHLESLPRIFTVYMEKAATMYSQPLLSVLTEAISAELREAEALLGVGRVEDANATLDRALTVLASFFNLQRPEQLLLVATDQADQAAAVLTAIFDVTDGLLSQKRFVDAASGLSYAGLFIKHFDITTQDGQYLAERLKQLASKFFGIGSAILLPEVQLLATADYVAPLLKAAGLLDEHFATGLCNLYRKTRSDSADFVTDLPLSSEAWALILDAFCFEESNLRQLDSESFKTESIPLVLHDLSKLPAIEGSAKTDNIVARSTIDVSRAVAIAIARHGEAANDMLPSWTTEQYNDPQDSVASPGETPSEAEMSSVETTSTAASSQDTSPLHRQDLPVTPFSASSSSFAFAPVEVVDVPFGFTLRNRLSHRFRQQGKSDTTKTDQVYQIAMEESEAGKYADPQALALLLVEYGRIGNIKRVQETYAMAQHVLHAIASEPEWQHNSWFEVEDAMIQALSHVGQPEAATVHRHRIIAAGRAPTATGYAALITATRDTTDDAFIAQELFAEAQRFGVVCNTYLYNAVISKLSRARKTEMCLQLFDDMVKLRIEPTSVTYGAVINACTRIGAEKNATYLFERMEQHPGFKPRVPPYNTMMQFYIQSMPDRQKALKYYVKMQKAKVAPSAHTYKLLLDLYGAIAPVQVKELEATFKLLVADRNVSVEGTHWASLINAYGCVLGDLKRATSIFDSIATHPSTRSSKAALPDAIAFEALLTVFVAHGRTDLMRAHVEKMKASGIKMTAYVANLIIRGFSMESEAGLQEARDLFESMDEPAAGVAAIGNHPPRAHGAGAPSAPMDAVATSQVTETSSASKRQGLSTFQGVQREPSTYETMVRAELEAGHRDRALAVVERMEARAFPPAVIVHAHALIADQKSAQVPSYATRFEASAVEETFPKISFGPASPRLSPSALPGSAAPPAAARPYSTSVRHASTMADSGANTSNPAPGPPSPNSPFTIFDRAVKTVQKDRAAARPAQSEDDAEQIPGEASRQTDYVRRAVAESLADRVQDIKREFPTIVELGAGPGLLRHYLTQGQGIKKIVMCDTSETLLHRDSHLDKDFAFEFERHVIDEENLPFEENSLDCIVVSGGLHWTNDLPGALIQIRRALKPDGVFIGALCGGDTLFELRTSLQLAEQEREGGISPRISPMADTRDMASLLSRAGFTIPTVDVDEVTIGYPSMYELMHDLRDMGESNAVINRRGFLRRDTMLAAGAIYQSLHELPKDESEPDAETAVASGSPEDAEGIPATFQLIFLIGWSPAPTQPKPLKRGSAGTSLKDVLVGEEGDVQAQVESDTQAPEEENKQLGQMLNSMHKFDGKKK